MFIDYLAYSLWRFGLVIVAYSYQQVTFQTCPNPSSGTQRWLLASIT